EKIKKKYNVQTYKEIIAFMEGKRLDEIQRMVVAGKYPYQKFLNFIISAVVAFAVSFVLGFIIKSII
ncbi:transcriptional regulator, partial [Anaerostipes caccae]|nr:transcriptional regulator [Anaerostipes caccae]